LLGAVLCVAIRKARFARAGQFCFVSPRKWEIVQHLSAAEISEAEISAAVARNEVTKGEIEDEFKSIPLNGCKGTDGPSETPEPIDLPPPDPGFLARSKPWRPVHQRLLGISADRRGRNGNDDPASGS
jgi:hypothetical protein